MLQQFTTTGTATGTSTLAIDFEARLAATLTGTISGSSGSMTFNGPGRLTLVADNTYSGATTVSAGTLAIGNGGTTGSVAGDLVTSAAVIFNRSDTVSYTRAIASSESGTSIAVSRRKASGRRWPHATWPLSWRTTCDCFNDACNSFTLRGPDRPADNANEAPPVDRHGGHRAVRGNLRGGGVG
jgi:autotransporter-associated beta strand protein